MSLDGLKCELKLVCIVDFVKQASSIQEVRKVTQELEQNQFLAEMTKLLGLILTIAAISAS